MKAEDVRKGMTVKTKPGSRAAGVDIPAGTEFHVDEPLSPPTHGIVATRGGSSNQYILSASEIDPA